MRIPTKDQTQKFLTPLRGRLSILLLHETDVKEQLSRFLLNCAAQSVSAAILDVDAYYCANLRRLALDGAENKAEILLPAGESFEVTSLLPLVSQKREFLIIDDLNSLYSLTPDRKRAHQLMILMRLLSHNARMNGSWVVATAYKAEPTVTSIIKPNPSGAGKKRSLTALGDVLVDVEPSFEGSLRFKAESKGVFPGDELEV